MVVLVVVVVVLAGLNLNPPVGAVEAAFVIPVVEALF